MIDTNSALSSALNEVIKDQGREKDETTLDRLTGELSRVERTLANIHGKIKVSEVEMDELYNTLNRLRQAESRLIREQRAVAMAIEELQRPAWKASSER